MQLTPNTLAQPKTKITVQELPYNDETQARWDTHSVPPSMATTYNGTQTFNGQGKPFDSDND